MAAAASAVDELVREYLLYKGFVQTLRTFDQERKEDKDKGLRVNRVVDYILQSVQKTDFNSLQIFWNHLSKSFFSRLSHDMKNTAHKLESTILRLFLINAHRNAKPDEIKAFFDRMSVVLQDRRDWKDWFALPYTRSPDHHPVFKIYFSKDWYDSFVVSLYNFFSVMFNGLPLPCLLQFEAEHQRMQTSATENNLLHNQLATTKGELHNAENTIQQLEARLAQSVAQVSSIGRSQSIGKSNRQIAMAAKAAAQKKTMKKDERMDQSATSRESSEERTVPFGLELGRKKISMDEDSTVPLYHHPTTVGGLAKGKSIDTIGASADDSFMIIDQNIYKEHSAPITHCKFSPGGTLVASVDTTGILRIWESSGTSLTTKSRSNFSKADLLSLDWIHHGGSDSLLMLGFTGCVVKMFDVASSLSLWEFGVDGKYPRIQSIVCSPSTSLFAVSAIGTLSQPPVLHGSSKTTLGLTSPYLPSQMSKPSEMLPMTKKVLPLSTAPSTTTRFEPTPGELTLWDINEQKIQSVLPLSPPTAVNSMSFNHNGNLLITGGVDGMLRLFDVIRGECICGWTGHHGEVYNVNFSSDETTVYSIGADGKFCQWSTLRSTEKVAQFNIHKDASYPMRQWVESQSGYFPPTPPGNLFAFESEDKFVLTCSATGGRIYGVGIEGNVSHVLDINNQKGPVTCVDWVPGRRSCSTCITGSIDHTIAVTHLLRDSKR